MSTIKTQKLTAADLDLFKSLICLFEDVFEMQQFQMPADAHLQQLLHTDSFLVFVALADGEVIGGLTAYTLQQYYSIRPLAYIYDLAVATDMRRRGIGRQLMQAITDYCQVQGIEEVFVQADNEDLHALDFYRATGGIAEEVTHFSYPLQQ